MATRAKSHDNRSEHAANQSEGRPDETEKERIDRELMELLQELRVAIPGVQVLFAFLLTIPFSQGFTKLDFTGKVIYSLTLVLAALATGSLIAPTSYHRIAFREGEKKRMLFTSNRLAIVGLGLLAAAISTSVVVVMIAVFDMKVGAYMGGGIALVLFGLWYGMPLLRKESRPDS